MSSITYFRKNSPYPGDVTKNCSLTGSEVDENFFTLEGRDVQSVELVDGKIVIRLLNGDTISTEDITNGYVKHMSFEFDEINGILTINNNGEIQTITGFATNFNVAEAVSVNGSIVGNGLPTNPIGISPVAKTGQYKPVEKILNIPEGDRLPSKCDAKTGERYLTIESGTDFGYLYNYKGLMQVARRLQEVHSPWRIPSKEDWDDMLNAIEPNPDYRNHTDGRSNKYLGKMAGKFLKSSYYWKDGDGETTEDDENNETCIDYSEGCGNHDEEHNCHQTMYGETGCCCHEERCVKCNGVDLYGFRALPAGYSNEAFDYMYFKERAYFWTSTNQDCRDAYIKVLDYEKCNVLQDILASDNYLSVRLVKAYTGDNYNEREDILGTPHSTVLMPSLNHGQAIWTSVNLAISNSACDCSCETVNYIVPEIGEEVESKTKYFTCEWNGKEWLRKELLEGESVVVKHEDGYKEYWLVNGELRDVTGMIYDSVMETVTENLNEINERIDSLDDRLNAEIARSTAKDEEHDEKISSLEERMTTAEGNIQTNADNIQALDERLTQTAENLAELRQDFEEAVETLNNAIAEEAQARQEKDAELEEEIGELEEALEAEKQERQAKDEELEQEITEVATDLEDETTARVSADEALEAQLIDPENCTFNTETGILTLKSKGETNDAEVQFTMNFGTF